jgi:hypothetical protein
MWWAQYMASMGEHRNAGFWWRNLKEREHYEDLDVESMIIL